MSDDNQATERALDTASNLEENKRDIVERTIHALSKSNPRVPEASRASQTLDDTPWTLQQFFNGEIDLVEELSTRFQSVPVLSVIYFRSLGTRTGRSVATLVAQDGSVQVVFDADKTTKVVQMSFTLGSMLTLRFRLDDLGDMDRERWLELMRREHGGMAFLWGPARWESDYLICVSRKYYTNIYAFSPRSYEAAVRLTPDVIRKLLDWLDSIWKVEPNNPDEEPPALLTW